MSFQDNQRIVKNHVEASGGVTGHNVRTVMALSVAGAVLALGIVFIYYFS
jgi:hypothetical protein